jgi:hypothetical protein
MNQFYLSESDESGVKACAESQQRGTSDTWTGLDSSGSIRTFSGVVQSNAPVLLVFAAIDETFRHEALDQQACMVPINPRRSPLPPSCKFGRSAAPARAGPAEPAAPGAQNEEERSRAELR